MNLLSQKQVTVASSSAKGVTFESKGYEVDLPVGPFTVYDTAGLNEEAGGTVEDVEAIAKLYHLMTELKSKGGISLLVFCTKVGRMETKTARNWHFFRTIICRNKVPSILVLTHAENERDTWWQENNESFYDNGIMPNGVLCITAHKGLKVDGKFLFEDKYQNSKKALADLIAQQANRYAPFVDVGNEWMLAAFTESLVNKICGAKLEKLSDGKVAEIGELCHMPKEMTRQFAVDLKIKVKELEKAEKEKVKRGKAQKTGSLKGKWWFR